MTKLVSTGTGHVDVLILGAGWTSTFLIPLLKKEGISYAATSTSGRDDTLKFKFDPEDDLAQYTALPTAKTILITFPLKDKGQSSHLVTSYIESHHPGNKSYQFIQLGSSGIFTIEEQDPWVTRHSKYNTSNPRAIAEDELLQLGGCVLNLSGLWGGARHPKNWIDRVAATKEQLKAKTSLHLIHGEDVARAVVAVHRRFSLAKGQRFIITNLMVYDWWDLIFGLSGQLDAENANDERETSQIKWIGELMEEQNIRALPRSFDALGRCYDTREFWTTFGLMPVRARV